MDKPSIDIRLHAKQGLVLQSPATEILFGGAAGPGKSFLVRAASIAYCCEIPGLQVLLLRRTFPELMATHMDGPGSFRVLLAPAVASGHCAIIKNEIRFANGSKIRLDHCQYEADVYRFQGSEVQMLAIDELTHFAESTYKYLRTRCRLGTLNIPEKYKGKFPLILCTSNPGGVHHSWVKEAFVDICSGGSYDIVQMPESEGGMRRSFIPAFYHDNPDLLTNDPEYLSKLKGAGDPETVRALVYGDWDVVSGAMFSAAWLREKHVVKSFPIPVGWPLWRGADDGFTNPACVLWFAKDPIHDRTYVVSEIYRNNLLPEELARAVLERDRQLLIQEPDASVHEHNETLSGIIDSAAFANQGTGSAARAETMNRLGCNWRPSQKYSGSRVHGVQAIHSALALRADGWPNLCIFESCKQLCRALPTVPRDEHNPEDIDDEFDLSHVLDALKYGLQWRERSFKTARLSGI